MLPFHLWQKQKHCVCASNSPWLDIHESCLWITDPYSRAPKKNTNHGNEVLPQDTTHLAQRPCYQQGSPCQDPAGNWTARRPPDDHKETQTAVVSSCLLSSSLAKIILQDKVKGERKQGRQRKRWEDNIREWTGLEFSKSQRAVENRQKMEKTGCKIICAAPATLAVKRLMMIMMMIKQYMYRLHRSHVHVLVIEL